MSERHDPRRAAVKAKLRAGEPVRLVNPMYASGALVELLSRRFDLIFFDCEHRGFDFETIDNLARAARTGRAATIVRPWSNELGLLARFLHCGVDGLYLPQIGTRAELQTVVEMMRAVRPAEAGTFILLMLVESVTAVENFDDILAVEELDGAVVGPHDLAVSMGLPRGAEDPRLTAMSMEVVRKARAAGKSASAPARLGRAELKAAGANITLTDVATLIRQATAALD